MLGTVQRGGAHARYSPDGWGSHYVQCRGMQLIRAHGQLEIYIFTIKTRLTLPGN